MNEITLLWCPNTCKHPHSLLVSFFELVIIFRHRWTKVHPAAVLYTMRAEASYILVRHGEKKYGGVGPIKTTLSITPNWSYAYNPISTKSIDVHPIYLISRSRHGSDQSGNDYVRHLVGQTQMNTLTFAIKKMPAVSLKIEVHTSGRCYGHIRMILMLMCFYVCDCFMVMFNRETSTILLLDPTTYYYTSAGRRPRFFEQEQYRW